MRVLPMHEEATKVCPRCRRELPRTLLHFYGDNRSPKDGLRSICKTCFDKDPKRLLARSQSGRKHVAKRYRAGKLPDWMYD
jgi:hypothetical protein